MQRNIKQKLGLIALIASLSLSNAAFAAANVTYSVDTTLSVNGVNLTVKAASQASEVIIGATTLTVSTGAEQTFTIVSANKYQLSVSPIRPMICTETTSSVVISGGISNVVITPTAVAATCPASGGATGGGGGGSSVIVTPSVTPAVTPVATPVGAFYDVPDTGKADVGVSIMDTAKISLEILKNTMFSTDVKGQKKAKYTDTVVAPTFVDLTKVAAKALPKNAKLLLAVQAVTTKQVKLSKMATWTIPVAADVAAFKSKLKAYYVNANTGMPALVLGGKLNAAKTAYIVKAKNLGGLLLIVKKN